MLKIAGVSDEGSRSPFILFRGSKFVLYSKSASMRSSKLVTSEQKMQSLIATALRTDLDMSVHISMKAVSNKFYCWHLLTI